MTPLRSQRKRVAFEMSNKSHTWFVLNPADPEEALRFFTSRICLKKADFMVYEASIVNMLYLSSKPPEAASPCKTWNRYCACETYDL